MWGVRWTPFSRSPTLVRKTYLPMVGDINVHGLCLLESIILPHIPTKWDVFIRRDIVCSPRWGTLKPIGSLITIGLRHSLKGIKLPYNTHYVRFPAYFTRHSFFIWKMYIVKKWSSCYRQGEKSGHYTITTRKTVVKSGGWWIGCGDRICLEGIIPMLTRPLTFWQSQIFPPKVIHIQDFFIPLS